MASLLDNGHDEDKTQAFVEATLCKYGVIAKRGSGMCGSVYFFDQGEDVQPRWIVAKVPRVPTLDRVERNRRFLNEIEVQHRTFYHVSPAGRSITG